MDGHCYRNKEADEEPCETNYGIGDEILVIVCSPEDNYESMDGDSLDQ
jgi:hypothetical protein